MLGCSVLISAVLFAFRARTFLWPNELVEAMQIKQVATFSTVQTVHQSAFLGDRIVMDKRVKTKTADAFPGPHDYKVDNPPLDPLFSEEIDYLIRMIRMREIYAIELMLEPVGLMVSAWLPLAALRIEDGMSQRELGARLNLKDAGIGQSVDALEKAGLVVREKDLNDRRKALVCLTPDGRKMANKVAKMRAKFQSAVVDGFSEVEKGMFRDMLQRSYLNIGALINASKQAGDRGGATT